jgi:hypothetical protein
MNAKTDTVARTVTRALMVFILSPMPCRRTSNMVCQNRKFFKEKAKGGLNRILIF